MKRAFLSICFISLHLIPLQAQALIIPSASADPITLHLETILAADLNKYQSAISHLPDCAIETDVFVRPSDTDKWNLGAHEKYIFSGTRWRYEVANVANEPIGGTFAFDGTTEMQKVCGASLILVSKGQTDAHATMGIMNSFFKPFSFLLASQNLKEGGLYSLTTGSNLAKLWTQFVDTSKSLSVTSDASGNYVLTRSTYIDNKFVSTDKITFDAKNNYYPTQYVVSDPDGKIIIKYSVLKWTPFPNMPSGTTFDYPSEASYEVFNPNGTRTSSMLFKISRIAMQPASPADFVLDLHSVNVMEDMETKTTFNTHPSPK